MNESESVAEREGDYREREKEREREEDSILVEGETSHKQEAADFGEGEVLGVRMINGRHRFE